MPDGSLPTRLPWRNPRPLPSNSKNLAADFWRTKPQVPPEPIERERGGLTVCVESAPGSPQHHVGATVADTVSQWTMMASAMYRLIDGIDMMLILPRGEIDDADSPPEGEDARLMAVGLDLQSASVHDATKPLRSKELRRKRNRSRIVRDGNPPQLDPEQFPREHLWAVLRINWIANKRFSLPDVVATNASGQSLTRWLTHPSKAVRDLDLMVYRSIARRGGGHGPFKKYGPKHFVPILVAAAAEHPELRDAPTPLDMGATLSRVPKS